MYDPSKVERWSIVTPCKEPFTAPEEPFTVVVAAAEFDNCAAALAEARKQRDEALRVVREYRTEPHLHSLGLDECIADEFGDTRCSTCKAADALEGGSKL